VSATAVQVLLGLWVGGGMHLVHPLVHCGRSGGPAGRVPPEVQSAGGCSHGCCHRHESEHGKSRSEESRTQAARASLTTLAHGVTAHATEGRCAICSFLAKVGNWTHLPPPSLLAHAERAQQPRDHELDVLRSLHFATIQARAPPSRLSFPA
jgi:hypothetical protein